MIWLAGLSHALKRHARHVEEPRMTRLRFDVVPEGDRHPLGREEVQRLLLLVVADVPELAGVVSAVRFGCNHRTKREGRIVQRGKRYEIGINFCLRDGSSRLLNSGESWLKWIKMCGGRPRIDDKVVLWDENTAARYAAFILLHEMAHIVYYLRHSRFDLNRWKGSPEEEKFCDEWAARSLQRLWDRCVAERHLEGKAMGRRHG